ncbi:Alpha/Beta hydrolase protein [Amylostereum chailletii]|nr:Alpha/Beta hydrolase protein [Amylostereum chailletii]
MPTAPVDANGTVLFFEDTGSLAGDYLTLVLLHGSGCHGEAFRSLNPFAAQYNLRLVTVNRRDYPGSTPLSDDDVAAVKSTDEDRRTEFFRKQAFELAAFLAWFVQQETIPSFVIDGEGRRHGGIVLLGWSHSTAFTLDLLANGDRLPSQVRDVLEPYMRGLCAYDVSSQVFGFPDPESRKFSHPWLDSDLCCLEKYSKFVSHFLSYFAHGNLEARDVSTLSEVPLVDPPPTVDTLHVDMLVQVSYPKAMFRWENAENLRATPRVLERTNRVFDEAGHWPRCRFVLVWCAQSVWPMAWGAWEMEKLYEKKVGLGRAVRPFEAIMIKDGSHAVHYEEPERICKLFSERL